MDSCLTVLGEVWQRSRANDYLGVRKVAHAEIIVHMLLTSRDEVNE